MNSREDLHYNLNQWPTGSESVDQELHAVIDRVFELETALKRYGQHDEDCRAVNGNVPEYSCDCGLVTHLKGKST